MGIQTRRRVVGVLVATAALVLASCGGGSSHHALKQSKTGLEPVSGSAGPGSTLPPAGAAPGPAATSSSTAPAGTAPSKAAGTPGAPGPQSGGQGTAGPAPAQPGTYRYVQTGSYKQGPNSSSQVPPEGTLVIEPPAANGTELWHRFPGPNDSRTDSTLLFNPSGMFIQTLVEHFGGITVTCAFAPPLPSPPWPPAVGQTFSAQGNCTGQGVTATVHVDGKMTGTDSLTLDGRSVSVYVAAATVRIDGSYQGAKIQATDDETDWFAPSLRLPVKTHSVLNGKYAVFSFSADTTSTLESGRPS